MDLHLVRLMESLTFQESGITEEAVVALLVAADVAELAVARLLVEEVEGPLTVARLLGHLPREVEEELEVGPEATPEHRPCRRAQRRTDPFLMRPLRMPDQAFPVACPIKSGPQTSWRNAKQTTAKTTRMHTACRWVSCSF